MFTTESSGTWEVIENACKEAGRRKRSHSEKCQTLLERLLDCYVDSVEGAPKDKRFRHGVHLLDKVVLQDNLSTLIVNFYPVNEGYSLMLKSKNGTESETLRLPYEETEFLEYLDAQQLPPMLVDLLEKSQANLFYNGCVIVEIRDYRCSLNSSSYDTTYVLLRPTCQTLVADVNAMTCGMKDEDKINLEASLLLATQSPLCLDPSPNVFNIINQLHYHKHKYRTHLLQRSHKRRFRSYLSQTRGSLAAPSSLKLVDFLAHHKHSQPPVNLRLSKSSYSGVDTWKQRTLSLAPPTEVIQVGKFSKKIESSKLDSNSAPETVQEIVLEGEKTDNRNYHCRVTIQRRPADLQYLGELYLHEDTVTKEITHDKGKCCKFFLGSKLSAQRYLQQFQDLYTEEGRKSVKISSYIPSQQHAINQAQNKNKVKAEDSRTPSPCQAQSRGQKTGTSSISNIKPAIAGKVAVGSNTITVQQDAVTSGLGQAISAGKISVIGSSGMPGNNGSLVMTANGSSGSVSCVTVQGNHYVTAIPVSGKSTVSSPSLVNQHETKPLHATAALTASYPQNVVGTYVQSKVVMGTTAIPVTPVAHVASKAGASRGSVLQGKFIATPNIKPGTQSIQPAGIGSITLIQSAGDQARRLYPTSLIKKKTHSNVTIQGQPVQITQRSNNATIAQLGSTGILPLGQIPAQLGINVGSPAQLAAKPVSQQAVTLSSSLTKPILQQQQPRQLTAAQVNTSSAVTMVTIPNSGTPLATITPTANRSTTNLAPIVPLQQPFQVQMVQFPQSAQSLQPRQITLQTQVPSTPPSSGRTPGRPNLRRRSSQQSNNSQK